MINRTIKRQAGTDFRRNTTIVAEVHMLSVGYINDVLLEPIIANAPRQPAGSTASR
jgi:hypothetical protein